MTRERRQWAGLSGHRLDGLPDLLPSRARSAFAAFFCRSSFSQQSISRQSNTGTEIFFSIPTPIDRPAIAGWAKARIVRPDRPSFQQRRGRKRWGRNPPLREGLSDSVRERRSSPPARQPWPAPVFPRMSRERPDVSVFSERCENKRSSRALYPFHNAPHIRHRRSARSRSACSCLSVVEPHSPQTHGH